MLVAEAVEISAIMSGGKRVVPIGDLFLESFILALGIRDLEHFAKPVSFDRVSIKSNM